MRDGRLRAELRDGTDGVLEWLCDAVFGQPQLRCVRDGVRCREPLRQRDVLFILRRGHSLLRDSVRLGHLGQLVRDVVYAVRGANGPLRDVCCGGVRSVQLPDRDGVHPRR